MSQIEPISAFYAKLFRYPGNNKQWWAAKATADDSTTGVKAGDFLPEVLDKTFYGNNRAPRGHYILNAYLRDRTAVSGVSGLATQTRNNRPNTITFFSGRAWFASDSTVYYSQIIKYKYEVGLCYQEADPTAEDISDLIDSDGGEIIIPEAQSIVKLEPFANGVIVFARNGVWFISGGTAKFAATNIVVEKISSFGTAYPLSIITVDDTIFWWSEIGIQALQQSSGQFGPITGKFGNTNIAEQTIQSKYNSIPDKCKSAAKGIYDPKNNIIQWLYSSDETNPRKYDSVLIFDNTLQAFYPWKTSNSSNSPYIAGVFLDVSALSNTVYTDIYANSGALITDNSSNTVQTSMQDVSSLNRPTNLTYTTIVEDKLTFSKFINRNYSDWARWNTTGNAYDSYIETGYELNNDAMRKKEAVRVFCYFRRTDNDPEGVPTSCKLQTKWDWTGNANSNRWSPEIEAYRPSRFNETTDPNIKENFPVLVSNNKVRGNGKSVQFRFGISDIGKNFDLLGWAVWYGGNTKP